MPEINYSLDILEFWSAGSGYGQGKRVNATVMKTASGLPFLPGKTVKGLIREAFTLYAEFEKQLDEKQLKKLFGSNTNLGENKENKQSRYETDKGEVFFTDAVIEPEAAEWLKSNPEAVEFLYRDIHSTSINDKGVAEDKTLRSIEVTVPLKLHGTIVLNGEVNEAEFRNHAMRAFRYLRSLGSHRRRGLGRVIAKLEGTL